jgi:RNA polymerase sigma-70 factor (ECF subfamily)
MGTERSADLLRRSADEPDAFGGFYDAYFEGLLRYLTRRTGDAEAGLDLTAESFAQAFLSRRRFRGRTDAEAAGWLYRIAKRQLARYFHHGRAERAACARLGLQRPDLDRDTARQIEQLAELDELRATLGAEVSELSAAHRQALWLRIVDELPYPEVARRLAISEAAARARVSRALRALVEPLAHLDRSRHRLPEETLT